MVKLITAQSYFGAFDALAAELKNKINGTDGRNLVFCEEKASLMAERRLCTEFGGSFNTDVYSFGNYLRARKRIDKLLSKEGSAMAVKRVLGEISLGCFKRSKQSLAPAMFELISQLKSANVSPEIVQAASIEASGILSEKLKDIAAVYAAYEKFLSDNGLEDQSSAMSYLPELINGSEEIRKADVIIFGFTGFTKETADAVAALIKNAKSFTAILTEGENRFAFVNETADTIRKICAALRESISEKKAESDYSYEGAIIKDGIFNPLYRSEKVATDKIFATAAPNPVKEAERIAAAIKKLVMSGKCRYRDVTVIVPDACEYARAFKNAFSLMETPFFLDARKISPVNPLVTLTERYIDVFKYGLTRRSFSAFFKNPLVSEDRAFADAFENYLVKHNTDGARLKNPLPDDGDENYAAYEEFRKFALKPFEKFSPENAFETLSVREKIERASVKLEEAGEKEEAAVNAQIYDAVTGILKEMKEILGNSEIGYAEYGRIFSGGVAALELSVIPQYNDAVFAGGFKEAAFSKAKYLFAAGLTSAVPGAKDDTALISDDDIDRLAEIKVLIEPKIKVVNHREREYVALGLSAFSDGLFVSYPIADLAGNKNVKSEAFAFLEKTFELSPFAAAGGYLTEKQGLKSFSYSCGRFIEGTLNDFTEGASFYSATTQSEAEKILRHGNKEVKIRLDNNARALLKDVTSPTAIEDFYKCPYRSFILHGLNVRDKEDGRVDGLKSGNLAHEIFKNFMCRADGSDDNFSFDECFKESVNAALLKDDFKGFFADEESSVALASLVKECEKYCRRFYEWLKASLFKTDGKKTEVRFGDDSAAEYPAIPLLGGKIKLSGKIDRVDTYKDYCRIIDYKTGSADDSEKQLFSGTKLQLYLYAAAVKDKKLAGAYYIPVTDAFRKSDEEKTPLAIGKTLFDEDALSAQDKNIAEKGESEFIPPRSDKGKMKNVYDEKTMRALVDYALKISENAARELDEGVIVPSPFGDTCEYCEFRALCGAEDPEKRSVKSVDGATIEKAVNGEEECPN